MTVIDQHMHQALAPPILGTRTQDLSMHARCTEPDIWEHNLSLGQAGFGAHSARFAEYSVSSFKPEAPKVAF